MVCGLFKEVNVAGSQPSLFPWLSPAFEFECYFEMKGISWVQSMDLGSPRIALHTHTHTHTDQLQ